MEKLQFLEMQKILGGFNAGCKAVQALADVYERDGATDAEWDEWADLFDLLC